MRQVSSSGVQAWLPSSAAQAPCIRWGASTQAGNPSAQGWADRASGVRSSRRRASSMAYEVCWLQPHTCPHQIVQPAMKVFTVYSTCSTVQK